VKVDSRRRCVRLIALLVAVGLVAAACTSDSGPDEFAEFPSIREPIEVLYSEQLMQDDSGRVVSCLPALVDFTCIEVFEIVGIDLADFGQTQRARGALWLSGVHLRGELDAPVLTVSSVNAEPDVETINDLQGFRVIECNADHPLVPLVLGDSAGPGVVLESEPFLKPGVVEYGVMSVGSVFMSSPVITRELLRTMCGDQDRPVLMYERSDLKVCTPNEPCEFAPGL